MRKLWWGILVLGLMGCVNSKHYYRETELDENGKPVKIIEGGTTDYWWPWGNSHIEGRLAVKQESEKKWSIMIGTDIESEQGEAAEIIKGTLDAVKVGATLGTGIPIP